MKTNEFYESFYQPYQISNMSRSTYKVRELFITNYLLKPYGEMAINDITADTINGIYEEAERNGLKPNSIFGIYAALSTFFHLAMQNNLIAINPIIKAKRIYPQT